MARQRGHKEAFARFFEEPSREALRDLLKQQAGEFDYLDFKAEWLRDTSLARHILGCANTGNACLVIGVKEEEDKTLTVIGLPQFTDKTQVLNGVKRFLPQELLQATDVLDFSFEASEYPTLVGKRFQVLLVEYDPAHIPFLALRDGDGIKSTVVYVRRKAETAEANHEEVQDVINRRIETRHSTAKEIGLKHHLEQLKVLYSEQPTLGLFRFMRLLTMMPPESADNSFDSFVRRMIAAKKLLIQREIGVTREIMNLLDVLEPPKPVARPVSEPSSKTSS